MPTCITLYKVQLIPLMEIKYIIWSQFGDTNAFVLLAAAILSQFIQKTQLKNVLWPCHGYLYLNGSFIW